MKPAVSKPAASSLAFCSNGSRTSAWIPVIKTRPLDTYLSSSVTVGAFIICYLQIRPGVGQRGHHASRGKAAFGSRAWSIGPRHPQIVDGDEVEDHFLGDRRETEQARIAPEPLHMVGFGIAHPAHRLH